MAVNSRTISAVVTTIIMAGCANQSTPITDAAVMARSMPVAEQFQSTLQAQLRTAMQTGGPIAGVSVCKEAAPAIAAEASEVSGAEVRRIALRHRNPGASVPENLRAAYDALVALPTIDGAPATRIVRSGAGETEQVHFLRAIPMQQQPCAVCHGTNVAPEVSAHIQSLYPADQAVGFSAGEMRGALVISWPISAFENTSG